MFSFRFATVHMVMLTSLYFSQGLPAGLLSQALPAIMREQGSSNEVIGLLKLLALPWAFKFMWAPFLDRYPSRRFGAHRGWILPLQFAVVGILSLLSFFELPWFFDQHLLILFTFLFFLNLLSATQDVATDGLAVKILPPRLRGLGNTIQVAGYKIGLILGGSLLLVSIDNLGWSPTFQLMAFVLLCLSIPIFLFKEQSVLPVDSSRHVCSSPESAWNFLLNSYRNFVSRPGMLLWIVVLLSYKVGDSFGSGMIKPLLIDSGFSLTEVGVISFWSSLIGLVGAFAGGYLYYWLGPARCLLYFGLLQAFGLFAYTLLAIGINDVVSVYAIALFEQFADGMSTVVLFAMMMALCRFEHESGDYTVQACAQLLVAGMMGTASGWFVSWLGYPGYFLMAGVLGLVALFPAWYFLLHYRCLFDAPQLSDH